jgi:hypothetical protein
VNESAAASLAEGLEETLTVHRLGVTGTLRRTLATTNPKDPLLAARRDAQGHDRRVLGERGAVDEDRHEGSLGERATVELVEVLLRGAHEGRADRALLETQPVREAAEGIVIVARAHSSDRSPFGDRDCCKPSRTNGNARVRRAEGILSRQEHRVLLHDVVLLESTAHSIHQIIEGDSQSLRLPLERRSAPWTFRRFFDEQPQAVRARRDLDGDALLRRDLCASARGP